MRLLYIKEEKNIRAYRRERARIHWPIRWCQAPGPTYSGRMAKHPSPARRAVERERYGSQHKALRTQWATRLKRERRIPCARCGLPIFHTTPNALSLAGDHVPACTRRGPKGGPCLGECWSRWELGHDDNGQRYTGPEHFACNRRAGGLKGASVVVERYGRRVRARVSRKP